MCFLQILTQQRLTGFMYDTKLADEEANTCSCCILILNVYLVDILDRA